MFGAAPPGRSHSSASRVARNDLRLGSLELDLIKRTAKCGERVIDLLPREFRLLEYMTQRNDQSLTRADMDIGRLRLKVRHAV